MTARTGEGVATPRDLRALLKALMALRGVRRIAGRWPELTSPPPSSSEAAITDLLTTALVDDVPATLRDGGVFKPGFDAELDGLRDGSKAARDWIAALEQTERQRTGIRSLKVGFNQVFRYYLEISHANREPIPSEYIRNQTLVNGERYVTPELKEKESLVLNAKSATVAREQALFSELCRSITAAGKDPPGTPPPLRGLDGLPPLAPLSPRPRSVPPPLRDEPGIANSGGR